MTSTGVVISGTSVGTRKEMAEIVALHARQPLANPIEEIGLDGASHALEMLESGRAPGRYVIRF